MVTMEVTNPMTWQNPSGAGLPPCRSFKLTLRHTLHPAGLLRTSNKPDAETST